MEYFLAAFLGGWMFLFGMIFIAAMKKEYAHYTDEAGGNFKNGGEGVSG